MVTFFPVSERRACALVEQPRSTQILRSVASLDFELVLRVRRRELVSDLPWCVYRRLHVLLVREGFRFHHKRVQWLYRDEGLRVRVAKGERARLGPSPIPLDRWPRCAPESFAND